MGPPSDCGGVRDENGVPGGGALSDERKKLVHAARIQIRNRDVGDFCDLPLQAERGLHDVGRVQTRIDLVDRLCRWRRASGTGGGVG